MEGMARCLECGAYSYQAKCPKCSGRTATPHPPRYSPEDRYGHYRRRLKKLAAEESE